MKNQITANDFQEQFNRVVPNTDNVVVIFSGIWSFGPRVSKPSNIPLPDYIIDLICESLGENKTIVFPTYTYNFTNTREYDLQESMPETGILPTAAFKRKDFTRTNCPLNSYTIKGPMKEELLQVESENIWSDDSLLAWFQKNNARICILGETWHQSCTLFHRIEEILQVPYRYYKNFPGKVCSQGKLIKEVNPKMFVRPLGIQMARDYTGVEPIMRKHNYILESNHSLLPLESANAKDIVDSCKELLTENIFGYLSNPDEVARWIQNEKVDEMKQQGTTF